MREVIMRAHQESSLAHEALDHRVEALDPHELLRLRRGHEREGLAVERHAEAARDLIVAQPLLPLQPASDARLRAYEPPAPLAPPPT